MPRAVLARGAVDQGDMLALVKPTVRLRASWLDAHNEWGPGFHEDGFGLQPTDRVQSADGFASWVERLRDESTSTRHSRADSVSCLYRWIVEDERVLGGITLRYGSGEMLETMGNVGYGIRASAQRRGIATWALGQMLGEARQLGLHRLLIVCEAENVASARTIEANGGVLERAAAETRDHTLRYWIDLDDQLPTLQ